MQPILLRVKSEFLLAHVILRFYAYPTLPTLAVRRSRRALSENCLRISRDERSESAKRLFRASDWKNIQGCELPLRPSASLRDATGNFSFIKDKGGWSTWGLPYPFQTSPF